MGTQETILLVDDDDAIRESLKGFLEDLEYRVLEAPNGRVGLDLISSEKLNLVVLDLRMPEVDGLEVLSQTKRVQPELPVIVVSGTGMIRDVVEAINLGADNYVLKPVEDLSILQHAIENSLEKAHLVRENQAYREHLEEEIKRRTLELYQTQRIESIGLLTGGIAHDFNNLLSPIIGFSELLIDDLCDDDARCADIRLILEAAQKAKSLTQKLLAFGRKQVLQIETVDLNEVLESCLEIFKPTIREDICISYDNRCTNCLIEADAAQIEQVVINLVVNAQDALPEVGVIAITIEHVDMTGVLRAAHPDLVGERFIVMTVEDSGIGMDKETIARAFDPFFTTKEVGKGTGLGLSTVFGIIQQHNGNIYVSSVLGKGTRFEIYFPPSENDAAARVERPVELGALEGKGQKILVVDDDNDVRRTIVRILSRYKYDVLEAATPQEALDMMASGTRSIDLVITDVVMPQMNGRELHTRLSESHERLRVVFISGYTGDILGSRGVLEEHELFIKKPVSMKELLGTVQTALKA